MRKFKVGQSVICTLGLNRGKIFVIKAEIKDGYCCVITDGSDERYYRYTDSTLTASA